MKDSDYCGCCGRAITGTVLPSRDDFYWCRDCAKHVGTVGPPHERTYFSLHATECPFEDKFEGYRKHLTRGKGRATKEGG